MESEVGFAGLDDGRLTVFSHRQDDLFEVRATLIEVDETARQGMTERGMVRAGDEGVRANAEAGALVVVGAFAFGQFERGHRP